MFSHWFSTSSLCVISYSENYGIERMSTDMATANHLIKIDIMDLIPTEQLESIRSDAPTDKLHSGLNPRDHAC